MLSSKLLGFRTQIHKKIVRLVDWMIDYLLDWCVSTCSTDNLHEEKTLYRERCGGRPSHISHSRFMFFAGPCRRRSGSPIMLRGQWAPSAHGVGPFRLVCLRSQCLFGSQYRSHVPAGTPPVHCLIDWLIDWLITWRIEWLLDWLIDYLSDLSMDWFLDCVVDGLTVWPITWVIDRWIDWLTDGSIHRFIDRCIEWLIVWFIDW